MLGCFGMRFLTLAFLILMVAFSPILGGKSAVAQELEQRTIFEDTGNYHKGELRPVEFNPVELQSVYEKAWDEVKVALLGDDWSIAQPALDRLAILRWQLGGVDFDEQSLWILKNVKDQLAVRDSSSVSFVLDKVKRLSPHSARVSWRTASIYFQLSKPAEGLGQLLSAARLVWSDPIGLISLFVAGVYPLLYSWGLAFYLIFVLLYLYKMNSVISVFKSVLHWRMRGLFAPLLALAVLILPLFWGLMWTVAVWAVLCLWLFGRSSWLSFLVACWLIIWGAVIPLRETARLALSDSVAKRTIAVAGGSWLSDDLEYVQEYVEESPDQAVGYYVLALALLNRGKYELAGQNVKRLIDIVGEQPYTFALSGIIAFQQGEVHKADQLMRQAQDSGLNSATHSYNYSRVKFEQLDSAISRELLRNARQKDGSLIRDLVEQEELAQSLGGMALQQIRFPIWQNIKAAFTSRHDSKINADEIASKLMPGLSPIGIMGFGVLSLLFFLFRRRSAHSRQSFAGGKPRFEEGLFDLFFAFFPGGACIKSGREALAVPLVWGILMALLPLFGWPSEFVKVILDNRALALWYYVIVACLVLIGIAIGMLCCGDSKRRANLKEDKDASWHY